jgi:DNA polymerase-4
MRKILHVDMDAFFASVEQRDFPELRGKPVIVGGKPESRGVVAACSYEARKFGVHSAMPSSRAAKLCKNAVFMPPRFDAYREASEQINKVFNEYTLMVQPLSLDEAYLDVTESAKQHGSATEVARMIKQKIKERVDLTASAGVSYNKFLAKIASDMDKPDGLYVIRPEAAEAFIEQLEIRKFFGVGKVTEKKMQSLGIYTGADLKALDRIQLQTQFGRSGDYYYNISRGIDERPVRAHTKRKSIGVETTFVDNVVDKALIWQKLLNFSEKMETALENKQMAARTLTLKVRYSDFTSITRSKTKESPIQSKEDMSGILPELLRKTEVGKRPIRLIGITLANLATTKDTNGSDSNSSQTQENPQLGLF